MPRLVAAIFLLTLVALASTLSYAGFLVVGVLAEHLGTGRLLAGLLLGVLFARLPWVSQGKLRTVGLLPKRARLPVMLALLLFCLLSYSYRGEWVPVLFLGLAAAFLLAYRRIRTMIASRIFSPFLRSPVDPHPPKRVDDKVVDVEFLEKKD